MVIYAITQTPPAKHTTKTTTQNANKSQHVEVPVGKKQVQQKPLTEAEKMQQVINKDFGNGVLTREKNLTLREKIQKALGKKGITEDYVIFHYDKFQEKNGGKKLTYGEIAKRYNLPPGTLKKANDLSFGTYQQTKGRSDHTDEYYPGEIGDGSYDIRIPASAMKKYLDAMGK